MTRGQLVAAALIEMVLAGAAGAVLAAAVAVAASPLMPIGAARLAEPIPGQRGLARAVRRRGDHRGTAGRPHPLAGLAGSPRCAGPPRARRLRETIPAGRLAGRAGAPVTMTAGAVAMELGGGRTAVPVRAALAGTTLSVLAVTAAFTFGANLLHLVHTPRLYGQAWDAAIDLQFSPILPSQAQGLFGTIPGITGWSYGDHGIIGINGHRVPVIGLTPGRGPLISPPRRPGTRHAPAARLCWGRPPWGTGTARRAGKAPGQRQRADRRDRIGARRRSELRPGQLHADRPRRGR